MNQKKSLEITKSIQLITYQLGFRTALAIQLAETDGVVLSTDDFFTTEQGYHFDPKKVTEAHEWNMGNVIDLIYFLNTKKEE